jgi:hypothetical protein
MAPKIAIIHYSMYGHVATMAEEVKKGAGETGATVDIYRVEETLPDDVLAKMGAPPKGDYPVITADKMTEYVRSFVRSLFGGGLLRNANAVCLRCCFVACVVVVIGRMTSDGEGDPRRVRIWFSV